MTERTSLTPDFQIGEAALASILAVSVDAIVAVDESQRIIFFNRGAEECFGWTAEEVIGQRLEMLIPHDRRPHHERQVLEFGHGPVQARRMGDRGAITGLRRNGEVFPAEASITHVLSNGRPVYTAVLRDVSARVRAERERADLLRREQEARATAERAERRAAQLAEASEIFASTLDFDATLENLAHFLVPWFADGCILDVVVGAGAKVLGGFSVGDNAAIGSNAVVTKPVPEGATAVGIPARIIQAEDMSRREEAAAKMGFSAYGVTNSDDPLSQAMRGLIDNAASQEHQIALLWQAIEHLSGQRRGDECVPPDAQTKESFEAEKLTQLVGK